MTLRAVGARAGLSRGAPYGHFADKEDLLTTLAVDAWNSLADDLQQLRADRGASPSARLEAALLTLIGRGRRRPYLYALMFSISTDDPAAGAAASRSQEQYLALVADVVRGPDARPYGALLMSSAHGIAGMELSGHLAKQKWRVDGDQLVRLLIEAISHQVPCPSVPSAASDQASSDPASASR